jgi:hypothetical protein
MSSINDIKNLYTQIKTSETAGTLLSEQSFEIGPGHKGAQKTQKLYNKGTGTDNPYEKKEFLKRTGPQLPLAKAKPGMQVAGYELDGDMVDEAHWNPVTKKVQDKPASKEEIESLAAKARTKKKTRKPQGSIRKTSGTFKPSSREDAEANQKSWDDYWSSAAKGYKEEYILEREMTSGEMKKEKKLKKKYDTSSMKKSMIDQYGKEKGTQIYFATIRKQAMANSFEPEGEQIDEVAGLLVKGALAAGGIMAASKGMEALKKKADSAIDKARNTSPIGGNRYANQMKQLNQSFDYDDAYDYVIEMLVAADYAESYEAAEVMFEHISDEFTSVILEEYIEEKARGTRKKTTVHAYDVDETLFGHGKKGKPNVQVHVKDASGKRVKSLSNQEFNTHKLDKGHSYDFSEFQSAKKFSQTASPNKKVIKDIKRKQARGQNVHLITARSKFDKPSEFQGHLKKHGVDVDKKNIHYTGGMKGGDIGKKKVDVANAVAKQSGAKKIHMYDDAAKVHKAFEKEKKEAPTSKKIKTHMVAPDKKGESRVRSYQATKTEEMTAYEYWKQFIVENDDLQIDENIKSFSDGGGVLGSFNRAVSRSSTDAGKAQNRAAVGKAAGAVGSAISNINKSAINTMKTGGLTGKFSRAVQRGKTDAGKAQNRAALLGKQNKPKPTGMSSDSARGGDAAFRAGGGDAAAKSGKTRQQIQAAGMAATRAKPKVGNIPSQEGTGKSGPSDVKPSKVISATNIAGKQQKVATNKAYDVKVGGVKGTATYGDKGQRMVRANLGNSGVNQVAKGKAKVGQSYGATLGGVKGTVKYDAKGNRSFQSLQKPAK